MFVVNKNTTQFLRINLSNEVDETFFLFEISGNGLKSTKLFFANYDSQFKERYHEFTIIENAIEDLLEGIISLPLASDLYVSIYNVDTKVLTIPQDETPVWKGLFRVERDELNIVENNPVIEVVSYDPRSTD